MINFIAVLPQISEAEFDISFNERTSHSPSGGAYYQPNLYYYDNKYYLAYQETQTNQLQSKILSFDKFLRDPQIGLVPIDMPNATDGHKHPSVIVTDNGVLLTVHEILATTATHNSDLKVRSAVDISDLSQGFNSPVTISGTFSYPQFTKIGSNIFLIAREGSALEAHIYKSINDGASWSKLGEIFSVPNQRLYKYQLCNPNEDKIALVCMHRSVLESNQPYTFVGYIESTDGDTWHNAGHTWSKQISTAGIITLTELRNNASVYDTEDLTDQHRISYAGFVKEDGTPVIMTEIGSNSSALYTFDISAVEIAYWSGSAWVKNEINVLTNLPETRSYAQQAKYYIHGKRNGNIVFWVDADGLVYWYESADNGVSWTNLGVFRKSKTRNANYFHVVTFNQFFGEGISMIADNTSEANHAIIATRKR